VKSKDGSINNARLVPTRSKKEDSGGHGCCFTPQRLEGRGTKKGIQKFSQGGGGNRKQRKHLLQLENKREAVGHITCATKGVSKNRRCGFIQYTSIDRIRTGGGGWVFGVVLEQFQGVRVRLENKGEAMEVWEEAPTWDKRE